MNESICLDRLKCPLPATGNQIVTINPLCLKMLNLSPLSLRQSKKVGLFEARNISEPIVITQKLICYADRSVLRLKTVYSSLRLQQETHSLGHNTSVPLVLGKSLVIHTPFK